ncbi:Peptidase family M13 [Popillia japonica]
MWKRRSMLEKSLLVLVGTLLFVVVVLGMLLNSADRRIQDARISIQDQPIDTLKSKAEQKAKLYYESCLDLNETIENLGAKPMLDLLVKIDGWNISKSNFSAAGCNLQKTLQIIQNEYCIGALFSYAVGEDDRNSSRHVIQIDQSGLTLPTCHPDRSERINSADEAILPE